MDSTLKWSITTPMGRVISTDLPRTIRTFEEFVHVDHYIGDSDPVYFALARAHMRDPAWAHRFGVAMLAYYNMGVALTAAEFKGDAFWEHLWSIYDQAPRGSARRHLRGAGGRETLARMRLLAPDPETFFGRFGDTYRDVQNTCGHHLFGFGPYFQLKICDFLDRCFDRPIRSYVGLERNLPGEPAKGLASLTPARTFSQLVDDVQKYNWLAPPHFDRPIGPAEVETSLCGWIHVKNGSTWMGEDILNKRNDMLGHWLVEFMPPLVEQGTFKCELS